MDPTLLWFALAAGLAVMLLLEALWNLWWSRHGPQARRLAQRLQVVSDGGQGWSRVALTPPRAGGARPLRALDAWVQRSWKVLGGRWLPLGRIQGWIEASGSSLSVVEVAVLSAALALAVSGLAWWWRPDFMLAIGGAGLGICAPWVWLAQRRRQRQERIERQFPLALDLISRALRAGHALSGAIRMAAQELPDPLVRDFRTLFEALNYGQPLPEALSRFAQRVPLPDAGYFAVAVIVQRDTGGNLAEVLDQIAALVRDRLRLRGEVRTLSAEGRLSAVILAALPFGVAAVVQVANPGFLSPLWTDPAGRQMVGLAALGMVGGVWWMRTLIRIRV
jgi:tight adherence protein B